MKDYSLGDDKDFIRDYYVRGNKIIINLANRKKKILPYDKRIEIDILKRMKDQVINMEYEDDIKDHLNNSIKILLLSGFFFGSILTIILTNPTFLFLGFGVYVFPLPFLYVALCQIWNIVEDNILLKDMKKNKLFLDNELKLNKKYNPYRKYFDINSVQHMSTKNLNNYVKRVNNPKKRVLKK